MIRQAPIEVCMALSLALPKSTQMMTPYIRPDFMTHHFVSLCITRTVDGKIVANSYDKYSGQLTVVLKEPHAK